MFDRLMEEDDFDMDDLSGLDLLDEEDAELDMFEEIPRHRARLRRTLRAAAPSVQRDDAEGRPGDYGRWVSWLVDQYGAKLVGRWRADPPVSYDEWCRRGRPGRAVSSGEA